MHLVVERLVEPAAAAQMHAILASARYVDGRATAGPTARDRKRNLELASDSRTEPVMRALATALRTNAALARWALPRRSAPLLFNRYDVGMEYGDHVDNALGIVDGTFLRTDIAVTVFLTPPDAYDGGELVVSSDGASMRFKLAAGDAIAYRAGTLHHVAPVTRGSRICAVTWIESLVPHQGRRQVIADLATILDGLEEHHAGERDRIEKCRTNLLRLWAATT